MSKTFLERLPPQNLDAERSVLGGILLDNSAMHKVGELLRAEHFYREAHREIFQAMFALHERGEPVDLVTLTEELQRKGTLQEVGGAAYLAALADQVPTAANIGFYAKIVRDKSVLRQVIEAATEIATRGYEEVEEVDEFLDRSEQLILEISRKQRKKGFVPIHDVVYQSFKSIEEAFNRKEAVTGIPTKFGKFDLLTCGLQRSDLVIIAGRPGMGKTAFALNIARNVAVEGKIPVAIFSLEMSKEQLVTRLFSAEAGIDSMKLRTGHFPKSYWTALTHAADVLAKAPIFIDDSPVVSVLEMRSKARQMKFQENIGLIVVDYLQLMSSGGRAESRIQEISEISRSLKQLAKELDVPVVALSQLNREPEKRNDKRPVLADLRESGAIEQDADLIVFLYREECYNRDKPECKGIAEVIIGKQRNGPQGTVQLHFKPELTRFAEIEERYDA